MMKKWLIILVCLLWTTALIQRLYQSYSPESLPVNLQNMDGLITPDAQASFSQSDASLELSCPYPDYLPVSSQQQLLTTLAKEFHIDSPPIPSTVYKDNGSISSLLHQSTNGTLSLQYLSIQEGWNIHDYLRICLHLPTSISLTDFRSILEEIKIKYGLSGTICTLVQGTYSRTLSDAEREKAANYLFQTLNASPVQSIQSGNTDTFYGYSESINSHILSNENKVNVTIAFADGPSDTTICYIGSPIILEDY